MSKNTGKNKKAEKTALDLIIEDGIAVFESLRTLPAPAPFAMPAKNEGENDVAYIIRCGVEAAAYAKVTGDPFAGIRKAIVDGVANLLAAHGMKGARGRPAGTPSKPYKRYDQSDRAKAYDEFAKAQPKPPSELEMSLGVNAQTLNIWRKAAGFTNGGKGIGKDAFLALYAGKIEDNSDGEGDES